MMSESQALRYSFASLDEEIFPLSRYLPPYYPGMVSKLMESTSASMVLDPIGASPRSILELGKSIRVIVNCSNPILAFLTAFLSRDLADEDFLSVMAELSILRRADERLEDHLKSLYLTRCSKCRQMVQADYFLYRRGESAPFARAYQCPGCGEGGQSAATAEDYERLVATQRSYPMHRSRAFARASTGSEDNAKLVNEILNLYLPRALYFIFTILNKIESLKLTPSQEEVLDALLLSVLDAGHSLNPWPESEEPPRTLAQPEVYVERNLWQVMENSITRWVNAAKPVLFSLWPQVPEGPGVSLHRGRMRDLAQGFTVLQPDALCSVIPRPYAAFWTLSAVWSTWLWGKESAAGFLSILERRRFDWQWYSAALQAAFTPASKLLKSNAPIVTVLSEPFTGLTNAVFNAASASSWSLSAIAAADDASPFQVKWASVSKPSSGKSNTQRIIREAIRKLLMDAGEPRRYTLLHAAVMTALASAHCLPADSDQLRGELPAQVIRDIQTIFAYGKFLRHLGSASSDPETGTWWLAQLEALPVSITDRIELQVVEFLREHTVVDLGDLMDALCEQFTGFLSPPAEAVSAILASYSRMDTATGRWHLNDHDHAQKRTQDISNIQKLVFETGKKLNFDATGDNPIDFIDKTTGAVTYRLFTSDSARVNELARLPTPVDCQYVYLFPGSRAGLIKWKIDANDLLAEITSSNWHFLKFRTMRHLAVRPDLSRELWTLLIDSDPISPEETTQLSMFNL